MPEFYFRIVKCLVYKKGRDESENTVLYNMFKVTADKKQVWYLSWGCP